MTDRSIRSLAHLQGTASTSRTLNLHAVWERCGRTHEHRSQPFFRNPMLNRAIIVRHRLRGGEADAFCPPRTAGAKVILPLDPRNLRAGGRYFFVGQRGYAAALRTVLGDDDHPQSRDRRILALLADLRSYDPFLLKMALKREGLSAAGCYFDISQADHARIVAFVNEELKPLVGISFDGEIDFVSRTAVLAAKVMANEVGAELEPLRQTLQLDPATFEDGVFCWKAFIYYKWSLAEVIPGLQEVLAEIGRLKSRDPAPEPVREALTHTRRVVRFAVKAALDEARGEIEVYDRAYDQLAQAGKPHAFREFLVGAPDRFAGLGERLGALNHLVSFWRFRFPTGRATGATAEELLDLLADFEASLNFSPERARVAA
jgi:hypothetical protein